MLTRSNHSVIPKTLRTTMAKLPFSIFTPSQVDFIGINRKLETLIIPNDSAETSEISCVGQFILQHTIGVGTMGEVKLAIHKISRSRAAVKILKKVNLSKDALKNVRREIAIMKLLDNPFVVKLIDVVESESTIFIIMEYAGTELYDYVSSAGALGTYEASRILHQIVRGINYCHSIGIVHRDLKPENILLDDHLNVKIADFGMSQLILDDLGTMSSSCGSPHYVAPEVIKGIPYNGMKSDIWSLGIIFYVMLTGSLPFNGDSSKDVLNKILSCDQIHISYTFPENIRHLFQKMTESDPVKRFSTQEILRHPAFIMQFFGVASDFTDMNHSIKIQYADFKLIDPENSLDQEILDDMQLLGIIARENICSAIEKLNADYEECFEKAFYCLYSKQKISRNHAWNFCPCSQSPKLIQSFNLDDLEGYSDGDAEIISVDFRFDEENLGYLS